MECPHCSMFVPENNFRCPHCKKSVKETVDPAKFSEGAAKRSKSNANAFVLILVVIGIAVMVFLMTQKSKEQNDTTSPTTSPARAVSGSDIGGSNDNGGSDNIIAGDLKIGSVVNSDKPGLEVQIEDFVQGDQMTIFDFYSQFCPPCRKISPWLRQLDEKRDDIVVFKVDINRPGIRGIDWRSPVAQQYGLKSIPHFVIYNNEGVLSQEGRPAYTKVMELLQKEGIVR
jgi:thioredoxin